MLKTLQNLNNIIIYSNKLYRVRFFFFIRISLNVIIISNLLKIFAVHNFIKISFIKENVLRFLMIKKLKI